jgi:hypothetical protein
MTETIRQPEHRDMRGSREQFADDEAAASEAQRHTARMARIIDYTPIGERGSPCLNGCMFCGEYGCMLHGSKIVDLLQKCEKYKNWYEGAKP